MNAFFSLIACIVVSISVLYTDTIIHADSTPVANESEAGPGKYDESIKSLQEEHNERESIPPSLYELYPDSDELDPFDDEEEASYCS